MALRILLVGLDPTTEEEVSGFLEAQGVEVTSAPAPAQALGADRIALHDAVALDDQADPDGVAVAVSYLKECAPVGVVVLGSTVDAVGMALEGATPADDCVRKPVHPRELLGRIQASVRRLRESGAPQRLSGADILVDTFTRRAWVAGVPVTLTAVEFDVLVALLRASGRVVKREELQHRAIRSEVLGGRSVDVHIAHLRKKIGDRRDGVRRIETVRGVGYVLAPGRSP